MHQKPLFEGERLERYMLRINRLLGNQEKTYSPWKAVPPKLQGRERSQEHIPREHKVVGFNRIMEQQVQRRLSFGMNKLKEGRNGIREGKRDIPLLKILVDPRKDKSILFKRIHQIIKQHIKQSFKTIKLSSLPAIKLSNPPQAQSTVCVNEDTIQKAKVLGRTLQHLIKDKYSMVMHHLSQHHKHPSSSISSHNPPLSTSSFTPLVIKLKSLIEIYHSQHLQSITKCLYYIYRNKPNISPSLPASKQTGLRLKVLPYKLDLLVKYKILYFKTHFFSSMRRLWAEMKKEEKEVAQLKVKRKLYFGNEIQSLSKLTKVLGRTVRGLYLWMFNNLKRKVSYSKSIIKGESVLKRVVIRRVLRNLKQQALAIQQAKRRETGMKILLQVAATHKFKHNTILFQSISIFPAPKLKTTNRCLSPLISTLEALYIRRLALSFWQLLGLSTPNFNQSCSNFIHDQILQFIDRQNHISLQLNRDYSALNRSIGVYSKSRSYDSNNQPNRSRGLRLDIP